MDNKKIRISYQKPAEKRQNTAGAIVYSIIPAFVYSGLILDKFFQGNTQKTRIILFMAMGIAYIVVGMLPYACVLTAIGNTVILSGLVWVLFNPVDTAWIRFVLRIAAVGMIWLMELGICICIMENFYYYRKRR